MPKLTAYDLSVLIEYALKGRAIECLSSPAPDAYYVAMGRAKRMLEDIPVVVQKDLAWPETPLPTT